MNNLKLRTIHLIKRGKMCMNTGRPNKKNLLQSSTVIVETAWSAFITICVIDHEKGFSVGNWICLCRNSKVDRFYKYQSSIPRKRAKRRSVAGDCHEGLWHLGLCLDLFFNARGLIMSVADYTGERLEFIINLYAYPVKNNGVPKLYGANWTVAPPERQVPLM